MALSCQDFFVIFINIETCIVMQSNGTSYYLQVILLKSRKGIKNYGEVKKRICDVDTIIFPFKSSLQEWEQKCIVKATCQDITP